MSENLQFELLPGEEILFYSPNKDRWENYRFDLMAYIVIVLGVVPYTYAVITILGFLNVYKFSYRYQWEMYLDLFVSIFAAVMYSFIMLVNLRDLKVYKNNYPLVLTNKPIIKEGDFLKKKKPIGTFIEGAEKVAYIEETRRKAYVYFKKDGEIKKVPLSYLSKYRDQFKEALKYLFEDRYMELILWKMRIPLNKQLIEEIFADDSETGR